MYGKKSKIFIQGYATTEFNMNSTKCEKKQVYSDLIFVPSNKSGEFKNEKRARQINQISDNTGNATNDSFTSCNYIHKYSIKIIKNGLYHSLC